MRLVDCKTWAVAPPNGIGGRYWLFVELTTDDGLVGTGEVYCSTFSAALVRRMMEEVFAAHAEGHDPHGIVRLWRTAYGRGYNARPDASLVGVISGLEMACWDIIGKAASRPV